MCVFWKIVTHTTKSNPQMNVLNVIEQHKNTSICSQNKSPLFNQSLKLYYKYCFQKTYWALLKHLKFTNCMPKRFTDHLLASNAFGIMNVYPSARPIELQSICAYHVRPCRPASRLR